MPIKDQQAKREYFQKYMAKKRKSLIVKPETTLLNPELVKPKLAVLNPTENVKPVKPLENNVKPNPEGLNPVKPDLVVKPCLRCPELQAQLQAVAELPTAYIESREAEIQAKHQKEITKLLAKIKALEENQPCPLNNTTLTDLFQQASEQVKKSWQEIISQGGTNQCPNCHNSQRNHQLAINLLEKYWTKAKKGEKNHA